MKVDWMTISIAAIILVSIVITTATEGTIDLTWVGTTVFVVLGLRTGWGWVQKRKVDVNE